MTINFLKEGKNKKEKREKQNEYDMVLWDNDGSDMT